MSDYSAESLPVHRPARVARLARPPGVVYAAAVLTWIGATGVAALTLILTLFLLVVAGPVFDAFDGRPDNGNFRWIVVGAVGVVVALSAAADVVAVFMLRGHRWARWVLVGLSVVAALGGVMSAYYIVPLVVTAAAMAVVVLLFLPGAREWFRMSHMPDRAPAP